MKEEIIKEIELQEEFLKDTLATHEIKTIGKALRIEYLVGGWTALNNLLFEIDREKAVELTYNSFDLLRLEKEKINNIIKEFENKKRS